MWMPYLIVGLIGLIIGFVEVVSTFDSRAPLVLSYIRAAGWTWGLILFNGCINVLVFAIVMRLTGDQYSILFSFIVGFGLPIVLRTKFTITRNIKLEREKDVTVNIGWMSEQIQRLFLIQIDRAFLEPQPHLQKILSKIHERKALYNLIYVVIQSHETLPTQEKEAKLQSADEYYKLPNTEIALTKLSLLLLEVGGWELVEQMEEISEFARAQDELISTMTQELTIDALKQIAEEVALIATVAETQSQFEQHIEDVLSDTASDVLKKSVLANFIVNESGHEFARVKLESLAQPPDSSTKNNVVYTLERREKTDGRVTNDE
ncbi:MAG: hypothetical protein H8D67_01425 [Deltaproteobacteria bacterium]|nr:hypothetical protein [Deltaproteobacteria bacterium]